jgi:hypothetical protein
MQSSYGADYEEYAQCQVKKQNLPNGLSADIRSNGSDGQARPPQKKGKAMLVTGREGPQGCETSRLPHFPLTIGSQMAVRLSALRAGSPLPPRNIPGTHFC